MKKTPVIIPKPLTKGGRSTVFNPLQAARDEPGGVDWMVDFLSSMARVALDDAQKAALKTLIRELPKGASMALLIERISISEADQLGITLEQYKALTPLIEELFALSQPGKHSGLFDK